MSVGATILRSPPGVRPARDYLPVATEAEFARYWQPLAESVGLTTVAAFGLGVPVRPGEIAAVLAELDQMTAAVRTARLDEPQRARMLDRLSLLSELLATAGPDVTEIYIG
jgi:hypothetical protein